MVSVAAHDVVRIDPLGDASHVEGDARTVTQRIVDFDVGGFEDNRGMANVGCCVQVLLHLGLSV